MNTDGRTRLIEPRWTACCAIALLLLATTCAGAAESWLEKRVRHFIFRGKSHQGSLGHLATDGPAGIESAFSHLAQHTGVPLCIESLDDWNRRSGPIIPIEINARDKTVREILEEMISQDRRYIYRERLGVVEVLPATAEGDPAHCLNMRIPVFQTEEEWNLTFRSLKCQIDRVYRKKELLANPMRMYGCPAGIRGGVLPHPPDVVKATFTNETVRDILSKLASMVNNVAWHAWFKAGRVECENISISAYRPRQFVQNEDDPNPVLSEEMPKKCTVCHYHRP